MLRHASVRTGLALLALAAAVLLMIVAIGFCLWGTYMYLSTGLMSPASAALLIGMLAFTLALGALWIGLRMSR